jgi:methylenetetrahydrofolate reductase (NADPH)
LFFDNENFKNYFQKVKSIDDKLIIIPGILPVLSYSQVKRMCTLCGTKIPKYLYDNIEKFKDTPDDLRKFGTEYAISQIKDLQNYGIKNFHMYTLNKADAVSSILDEITEK